MGNIAKGELKRYMEASRALAREGHLDKGDRWLMLEACRRAGLDVQPFERKFFGPPLMDWMKDRISLQTKPHIGVRC